jgi:heme O synthase-like polyprenyltransferase
LDLAAALIKLSKISAHAERRCEELMTAFAQSPAALMNARVERLIAWNEDRRADHPVPEGILSPRYASLFSVTVTVAAIFAVIYPQLLAQVHEATEWLVR